MGTDKCEKCIHVDGKHCLCMCHLPKCFFERGERMQFRLSYVVCHPDEVEMVKDFLNS